MSAPQDDASETIAAATPGPWHWSDASKYILSGDASDYSGAVAEVYHERDRRFIAEARIGWPRAIDALQAFREALDRKIAQLREPHGIDERHGTDGFCCCTDIAMEFEEFRNGLRHTMSGGEK